VRVRVRDVAQQTASVEWAATPRVRTPRLDSPYAQATDFWANRRLDSNLLGGIAGPRRCRSRLGPTYFVVSAVVGQVPGGGKKLPGDLPRSRVARTAVVVFANICRGLGRGRRIVMRRS